MSNEQTTNAGDGPVQRRVRRPFWASPWWGISGSAYFAVAAIGQVSQAEYLLAAASCAIVAILLGNVWAVRAAERRKTPNVM